MRPRRFSSTVPSRALCPRTFLLRGTGEVQRQFTITRVLTTPGCQWNVILFFYYYYFPCEKLVNETPTCSIRLPSDAAGAIIIAYRLSVDTMRSRAHRTTFCARRRIADPRGGEHAERVPTTRNAPTTVTRVRFSILNKRA